MASATRTTTGMFIPYTSLNTSTTGDNSLTPSQEKLLDGLNRNITALDGQAVQIIRNEEGEPFSPPLQGTVTWARVNYHRLNDYIVAVVLANDSLRNCYLHQIELAGTPTTPTKPNAKTLRQQLLTEHQKAKTTLKLRLSTRINSTHERLVESVENLQTDCARYEERLEFFKKELIERQLQLSQSTKQELTDAYLVGVIQELLEHKQVAQAYWSTSGNLIVLTKPLVGVDPTTDQPNPSKQIGRMAFKITPDSELCAVNLDYALLVDPHGSRYNRPYFHPNIEGSSVCLGDNSDQFYQLASTCQFYRLVDLAITFFSLHPHDGGSPYVDHGEWMMTKQPITNQDTNTQRFIRRVVELPLAPFLEPKESQNG